MASVPFPPGRLNPARRSGIYLRHNFGLYAVLRRVLAIMPAQRYLCPAKTPPCPHKKILDGTYTREYLSPSEPPNSPTQRATNLIAQPKTCLSSSRNYAAITKVDHPPRTLLSLANTELLCRIPTSLLSAPPVARATFREQDALLGTPFDTGPTIIQRSVHSIPVERSRGMHLLTSYSRHHRMGDSQATKQLLSTLPGS